MYKNWKGLVYLGLHFDSGVTYPFGLFDMTLAGTFNDNGSQ